MKPDNAHLQELEGTRGGANNENERVSSNRYDREKERPFGRKVIRKKRDNLPSSS